MSDGKKYILDITHQNNHRKTQRIVLEDKHSITLGRSLDCDVIMQDPYISRNHVKLSMHENVIVAEDLNSKNGTLYKKSYYSKQSFEMPSGECFRIGQSTIRIFHPDHSLPPTKKIKFSSHLKDFLVHPFVAVLIFMLVSAVMVGYAWLSSTQADYMEEKFYKDVLGVLVVLLGLTAFIAIGTVAMRRHLKFFSAMAYCCLIMLSIQFANFICDASLYRFKDLYWSLGMRAAIESLFLVSGVLVMIYLENGRVCKKDWAALILLILFVCFIQAKDYIMPDRTAKLSPHYEVSLPIYGWTPKDTVSLHEFRGITKQVYTE